MLCGTLLHKSHGGLMQTAQATESEKMLGRFYTPPPLAQVLTDWAIRTADSEIFDPSFGGCAFFSASLESLRRLGAQDAGNRLFGVDIDPHARAYLERALNEGGSPSNFLTADFLAVSPEHFSVRRFDAVVGNPPYVRHHFLNGIKPYRFSINGSVVNLSARASYWAHFVLHSLQFVRRHGRLALVLPGSFIYSNYSESVRNALRRSFRSITMILIEQQLFHNAEELSVVLLGEDRDDIEAEVYLGRARDPRDLRVLLEHSKSRTRHVRPSTPAVHFCRELLDPQTVEIYEEIAATTNICTLGNLAQIRLGIVTGCNEVLVIAREMCCRLRLRTEQVMPVVVHSHHLNGLRFTSQDHYALYERDVRCLLIDLDEDEEPSLRISSYLRTAEEAGIHGRYKCRIRDPWYSVGEINVPDAFISSLAFRHVRFALNRANVACTNSIYAVSWRRPLTRPEENGLSFSSLSSLFRFGAEYWGRAYGGGALKLEPSEAARLPLPRPGVVNSLDSSLIRRVDSLLRAGQIDDATGIVDKALLRDRLGMTRNDAERLTDAGTFLQNLRTHAGASKTLDEHYCAPVIFNPNAM
jgi:adenine-specific DNA-methyltransferase